MVTSTSIHMQTRGECEILDITRQVVQKVEESGIKDGTVTVFVPGSTGGITTIEYERGVLGDFQSMWQRTVPRDIPYGHDAAWRDGNGHSHVRASMLGPSLVIPFVDRRLTLGTWQQVVFGDFDN